MFMWSVGPLDTFFRVLSLFGRSLWGMYCDGAILWYASGALLGFTGMKGPSVQTSDSGQLQ